MVDGFSSHATIARMGAMTASHRSSPRRRSIWSHRNFVAAEVVLVIGLLKSFIEEHVLASGLPPYGKVLFVMAGTIGLLGSLYWLIEGITRASVSQVYGALNRVLPGIAFHAAILFGLYLLYANRLELAPFGR
jgi:hypothetical protein